MPFCNNCGQKLAENAKFCNNCGEAIAPKENTKRATVYDGEIHKCPNCGEVLKSFSVNCPACGYEIRGTKASLAVKEFAYKLESIESKRKHKSMFVVESLLQTVSKTDEQKINLIKNFVVPNSKEDMLEFMILATSNMNMDVYDSTNTNFTKAEKEINAAWFAKVQQIYEKAKRSYSTDDIFIEIKELYDKCNIGINKSKKKGTIKWILLLAWIPILLIIVIVSLSVSNHKDINEEPLTNAVSDFDYNSFIQNYEKAEFERYNSNEAGNSLSGDRIFLECTITEREILESKGTKSILGYVIDNNGNGWLIQLHFIPAVSETYFDRIIGKPIILRGVYNGFSNAKEMPFVILDEILVKENGERISGMQKLLDE